MKHYEEIANRVLERRDEYVARQSQKRKTMMKIASVTCAFALVALVGIGAWQAGGQNADPAVENAGTSTTLYTAPTESKDNTGGDGGGGCVIHSVRYHRIPSNFRAYDIEKWEEAISGNPEDFNIENYVDYFDISREEFIKAMGWDVEKLDEKIDDQEGPWRCPYTYNQFLDAIYGDDVELKNWVFARERETWIKEE